MTSSFESLFGTCNEIESKSGSGSECQFGCEKYSTVTKVHPDEFFPSFVCLFVFIFSLGRLTSSLVSMSHRCCFLIWKSCINHRTFNASACQMAPHDCLLFVRVFCLWLGFTSSSSSVMNFAWERRRLDWLWFKQQQQQQVAACKVKWKRRWKNMWDARFEDVIGQREKTSNHFIHFTW